MSLAQDIREQTTSKYAPDRTRSRGGTSLLAGGENMIWLTGGSLVISIIMIVGLLALVVWQGIATFWPGDIVEVKLAGGRVLLGEVTREESYPITTSVVDALPDELRSRAMPLLIDGKGESRRELVRTGNYELTNTHFEWVDDYAVDETMRPEWALLFERRSWGRFYGYPQRFIIDGESVAESPEDIWKNYNKHHGDILDRVEQKLKLQKFEFGKVHARMERARLELRNVELEHGTDSDEFRKASAIYEGEVKAIGRDDERISEDLRLLDAENERYSIEMRTSSGALTTIRLDEIVRGFPANRLSLTDKASIYVSRWWEFLTADPRSANSEGGVWPAIVGTVIMTLLMSVAVVPFGVLAALYLREYAKEGAVVSAVRIAINNLAGVPSIVFGVFGLGFFCYILGGSIDEVFFSAKLPNPTYGKGGVLWASLTLALLTLPVVVVATEEALAAVPRSMREGSYACGASKWQTIRRIVLPRAMPGIMTGFILAMARGAGEVAPLMLVGAAKLAPDLPLDSVLPYLHPERSFMHLGFHIYDVGFQSQNSEAAKPMVYTTTLLLITIIATLNLSAVWVRTRLRRKFVGTQF